MEEPNIGEKVAIKKNPPTFKNIFKVFPNNETWCARRSWHFSAGDNQILGISKKWSSLAARERGSVWDWGRRV